MTKLNEVITVTEKLFSLDIQYHTKNNSRIFQELGKNQHQTKMKRPLPKRCEKNESYKIKFSKSSQNKST